MLVSYQNHPHFGAGNGGGGGGRGASFVDRAASGISKRNPHLSNFTTFAEGKGFAISSKCFSKRIAASLVGSVARRVGGAPATVAVCCRPVHICCPRLGSQIRSFGPPHCPPRRSSRIRAWDWLHRLTPSWIGTLHRAHHNDFRTAAGSAPTRQVCT